MWTLSRLPWVVSTSHRRTDEVMSHIPRIRLVQLFCHFMWQVVGANHGIRECTEIPEKLVEEAENTAQSASRPWSRHIMTRESVP
jgi:hypothetical protein